MEPDDLPPDPLAQLDQAIAGMGDMARLLRGFYVSLLASGFEPYEAMYLTANYHTANVQRPQR